ncbi:hypothetical protein BU25DRAFT_481224 [Macroventuria anomochaeta]|uniref:Uncharacterized protein n=1 Tax=Macroventuria anomochaeta TaxID=301207 RepID=A0ACB6RJ43_9PLEO|nr:uncharacterized protein BU25DRAFT_481224 [Macroventuria anomochaeta]KAF2621930.1 hypothetical protein BU25DRAFT_481224 [Macroventuria anomochaeta]
MLFHAYPEEQRDLRWVSATLTTIATLLLLCRLSATVKNRGWLGLEDGLVIAANVFLIIFTAMIYEATIHGFGMRIVDIKRSGGDLKTAMKFFWLTQSFYILTNGFNKMAFVALYYRIFPLSRFRQACMVLMGVSIGWTVSYLFVIIFQCTPVPRVYDRTIPGTCINFFWQRWSNAVSNLLTDISVFILPIPVLVRLNMSIGSRIGLVMLFCIGFFICLTTALRMATLPLTLRTNEPSWESAPTNLWSFIESATGVICACLISLRQSVCALWPKRWRSRKGTSSGQCRYCNSDGPSIIGSGHSQQRDGTGAGNTSGYRMGDVTGSRKGVRETYASTSPSESQEQIVGRAKTEAHVTTTMDGRKSVSESDDLDLQGIKVTTDFQVVRD